MSEILVYTELLNNEVTDVSRQCLTMARQWADDKSLKIDCVAIGSDIASVSSELTALGADRVTLAEDSNFASYLATPYKKVLADVIKKAEPKVVLMPASTQGNDLAATVSTELGMGCVLDCHTADFQDNTLVVKRLEFDRKVLTMFTSLNNTPIVATLKDGIIEAGQPDSGRTAETDSVKIVLDEADLASRVIKQEIGKKTVDLKATKTIVTAGAGIGTKDNYKLVEELAEALNGEVGATRPVVDAGWASADRQIGQTGTTVKPDLYIACGVSGAVQHKVGMMDSKTIVAINSDPSAPIFKFANYCIVGDLTTVIPKLIKLIK